MHRPVSGLATQERIFPGPPPELTVRERHTMGTEDDVRILRAPDLLLWIFRREIYGLPLHLYFRVFSQPFF